MTIFERLQGQWEMVEDIVESFNLKTAGLDPKDKEAALDLVMFLLKDS